VGNVIQTIGDGFVLNVNLKVLASNQALVVGHGIFGTRNTGYAVFIALTEDTPFAIDLTLATEVEVTFEWTTAHASNVITVLRSEYKLLQI